MGLRARLWSLSGLSTELQRNVRAVGRALEGVEPDGQINGHDGWKMAIAVAALESHAANGSRRNGHRTASEEDDSWGYSDAVLDALEAASDRVEAMLQELRREPDAQKRRALFQRDGRAVGALHDAFEASLATDPVRLLHEPFARKVVGHAIAEAMSLCNLQLEKVSDE